MLVRFGHFLLLAAALFAAVPPLRADPVADAMREVEQLRQQRFTSGVTTETIGRHELPARLRAQIEKSQPYSFSTYSDQLRALHLVEEEGDLLGPLLSLLEGQVLAYYDPDTDRFFFVTPLPPGLPEEAAGMLQKSVVAHELVHALQDQRIDLGRRDRELLDDWDASLALHAVVEGEATLVMMASLLSSAGASLDDVIANDAVLQGATAAATAASVEGDAPRYFVESLKFPYLAGLRFVAAAYRRGGWAEVDRLLVDPPRSTREILAPEEYFTRSVPARPFPRTEATPRRLADIRLGQEHWSLLLREPVAGWLDDRVSVLLDEACRPTVLATTEWESESAAKSFARRYEAFLEARGSAPNVVWEGRFVRAAYGFDAEAIVRFLARVHPSAH